MVKRCRRKSPESHHRCQRRRQGRASYADGGRRRSRCERRPQQIHEAKLDALEDPSRGSVASRTIVAYIYKARADLAARTTAGALSSEPGALDAWNRGEVPILWLRAGSDGYGLNLQDGSPPLRLVHPALRQAGRLPTDDRAALAVGPAPRRGLPPAAGREDDRLARRADPCA